MADEQQNTGLIKRLDNWLTDNNLGPETKKLVNRLTTEIKTDDDAGVLNRLFDTLTGGGK